MAQADTTTNFTHGIDVSDGTNGGVWANGAQVVGPTGAFLISGITGNDSSLGVTGQSTAQGGSVDLTGGTSSTSGNAGGAVTATGGTPGATGVGGAVTIVGGIGGATSGTGGAVSMTGGAGTGVTTIGGAASVVGGIGGTGTTTNAGGVGGAATLQSGAGGAKTGTGAAAGGAAGAVTITGGVGGATASSGTDAGGAGSTVTATAGAGGAASAGTGNGGAAGSVVIVPGIGGTSAGGTAGVDGGIFLRSTTGRVFMQQVAPGAGSNQNEVLTAAMMFNGIFVHTIAQARTLTTPTGAAISAACPASVATGDSFNFNIITIGAGADDICTLTAGDGNVTFVGDVTCGPQLAGTHTGSAAWRFRKTGASTWIGYRLA